MRWAEQLPWVARPIGQLPRDGRERLRVYAHAARDLPAAIRLDATVEMAAGMTFFLLFSLFPGLLFLFALVPQLHLDVQPTEVETFLLDVLGPFLPEEIRAILANHIEGLINDPKGGLLTVSGVIALYSASRALVSLSRALNRAWRVPALKSEFSRRLRSMLLTMSVLIVLVLTVLSLSLGDWAVAGIVSLGWIPVEKGLLINIVRWPTLLVLSAFLLSQLYYLLVDVRPRWRAFTSGSLLAILTWTFATWAFTNFSAKFISFNVTYGSLGSAAVALAWMYLGSFSLMLGGSWNALVARGLPGEAPVLEDPPPDPTGSSGSAEAAPDTT